MLERVICTADLVGIAGRSSLSIAQILGVSDVNNRRDRIRMDLLIHEGRMVQAIEGSRNDIDRLLRRMHADERLDTIKILSDRTIASHTLTETAGFCHEPAETLSKVGLSSLADLSLSDAEALMNHRQA